MAASSEKTAVPDNNESPRSRSLSEKDLEAGHGAGAGAGAGDVANTDGDGDNASTSQKSPSSPTTKNKEPLSAADEDDEGKVYPPLIKVIPIMACLYLSLFLISLDRTIISTAVPQITDDFDSVDDIGWYASAYMITSCAFQLLVGKIYSFYSHKWVFLVSVFLFEIGSLLCAVASGSTFFIIGRAIAGSGSAGLLSGAIVLTVHLIPLRQRPIYQGFMGAIFLISSVTGPIIGGAFTTHSTWRWCFYLNLPIGGIAIVLLLWLLPSNPNQNEDDRKQRMLPLRKKLAQLDPIGTFFFLPGVVCLLLALQWGGSTYAWDNARIIVLWVLFGLLMIAFIAVQIWKQEDATLPPRIVMYRSVTASSWFAFFTSASVFSLVYFLPLYFQVVKGVSAFDSGIRILPLIIALMVGSFVAGPTVAIVGYYTPFLIASSIIMAIGAGLIMTFKPDTSQAMWMGYQIVYGFGCGLGQQQAGLAAQVVLPVKDVPIGVSFKFFAQALGGAVFASVAQSVFNSKLISGLTALDLPGVDPQVITALGATELTEYVGIEHIVEVISLYNDALSSVFEVAMITAALSLVGALLVEWKSVKGKNLPKGP